MKALLVDPSLFTAPYDAALTEGLVAAAVEPMWATRPAREGERQEIPIERSDPFFYRGIENTRWVPATLKPAMKGAAHLLGLAGLLRRVWTRKPDVVHFQWSVVPALDALAMALIRRRCPLVLTVHDSVPFNGQKMSWLQAAGQRWPVRLAHRVVVHTRSGMQALVDQGTAAEKVIVIPHGPLRLPVRPPPLAEGDSDPRWTFLLFGEIKPYKGLDVLIEAIAVLPEPIRRAARVVVAGRPRMDVTPLLARIETLGLQAQFELRFRRQSETEMASLFARADCFVLPYRQIDASGVYFLAKPLGKWLVASRVGIFAEDMVEGVDGALVPPGDVAALADALAAAIGRRPRTAPREVSEGWASIGCATRTVYEDALGEFAKRPGPASALR